MIGKTVSHYEILAKIGEGGMGVVYRARDTRLGREVALKFLSGDIEIGPDHLKRFQREAEVLAALNHAGIAVIHDVGEVDDRPFLALELLQGETLAARLERGTLPPEQAIPLMRDVASALAAAHSHGVIHRDLKPSNLMLSPEGVVKILDFGLARIVPLTDSTRGPEDKTVTISELTRPGRMLGTAGYMSPEQVRGEPVDARADIWAFGCILFECLTGQRAFPGATLSECVAAVLMGEPDWTLLPDDMPPGVKAILERCLRKDSQRRYHSVADVGIELEDAVAGDADLTITTTAAPGSRPRLLRTALVALAAGLACGALLWQFLAGRGEPPREPFEFAVPVAADVMLGLGETQPIVLSPDGRRLAIRGRQGGVFRLYYFELGTSEVVPLAGTEGAVSPFFSPCGDWIAFFAENELRKISVVDGSIISICHQSLMSNQHGTWGDDGTILFEGWSKSGSLFQAVPANGGEPWTPVIDTDLGRCLMPSYLPGAKSALVVVTQGQSYDNHWLAVLEITTGKVHPLLEFTTGRWTVEFLNPQYLDTGHIVYVEEGAIKAVPFDPNLLQLCGDPIILSEKLTWTLPAYVAVSRAGTIAYNVERKNDTDAREPIFRHLLWVDQEGEVDSLLVDLPGRPMYPIIAPDGRHMSLTVVGKDYRRCWALDLERQVLSPLTHGQNDHVGLWSPDGRRLVFSSDRDGPSNLYWKPLRAGVKPERLTWSDNHQCPSCWTPDGKEIVFTDFTAEAGGDIWILDPTRPGEPRELVVTANTESHGMVSPDGRWLAYTSSLSGRCEVYLDRFPDTGTPVQVSNSGGHSPLWSPDGRELYYMSFRVGGLDSDESSQVIKAVTIETDDVVPIGSPRELFTGWFGCGWSARPHWDITPDGSRFLLISAHGRRMSARDLRVVLNWSVRLE